MDDENISKVLQYYQHSDRELARRYLADQYPDLTPEYFRAALQHRYKLYPHLVKVAQFDAFADKDVLEIGVGQGADHFMFASAGARMTGIDVTAKHCAISRLLLESFNLTSHIVQADARTLPFPNESFDHVYSCGVLLLFPDIARAMSEIRRVLRPHGHTTIMLYNKASIHYWIKTRLYYGWCLGEDAFLRRETVNDWYTDGIGYPKVHYYSPRDLPRLFSAYSRVEFRTACLTPEQVPVVGLPTDAKLARWLENHFGFYLWVRAWA